MRAVTTHENAATEGTRGSSAQDLATFSWENSAPHGSDSALHEANLPAFDATLVAVTASQKVRAVNQTKSQIAIDRLRLMAELIQTGKMTELHKKLSKAEEISGWKFDLNDDENKSKLAMVGTVGACVAMVSGVCADSFFVGLGVFVGIAGTLVGGAIGSWFLYRAYKRERYQEQVIAEADEGDLKAYTLWKEVREQAREEGAEREYTKVETDRLFSSMLAERVDQLLDEARQLEGHPKGVSLAREGED